MKCQINGCNHDSTTLTHEGFHVCACHDKWWGGELPESCRKGSLESRGVKDVRSMTEEEKTRLELSVGIFANMMRDKLIKKMEEGYHGWDDRKNFPDEILKTKLRDHVNELMNGKEEEIDIANFCMMLWIRRQL
jgi:hypothetical protein